MNDSFVAMTNVTTETELRRAVLGLFSMYGVRGTFVPIEESPPDGYKYLALDYEVPQRPLESVDQYSARHLALMGTLARLPGVVGSPLQHGERVLVLRWRPSP